MSKNFFIKQHIDKLDLTALLYVGSLKDIPKEVTLEFFNIICNSKITTELVYLYSANISAIESYNLISIHYQILVLRLDVLWLIK